MIPPSLESAVNERDGLHRRHAEIVAETGGELPSLAQSIELSRLAAEIVVAEKRVTEFLPAVDYLTEPLPITSEAVHDSLPCFNDIISKEISASFEKLITHPHRPTLSLKEAHEIADRQSLVSTTTSGW